MTYNCPYAKQNTLYRSNSYLKIQTLREKRATQGWPLEIWSTADVQERCPQVALESVVEDVAGQSHFRTVKGAVYSPADGQVHPAELVRSLVRIATKQGVHFHSNIEVTGHAMDDTRCNGVHTSKGDFTADWVVLCAGLGSAALTLFASEPLELMPVLGQALEILLPHILFADFIVSASINCGYLPHEPTTFLCF